MALKRNWAMRILYAVWIAATVLAWATGVHAQTWHVDLITANGAVTQPFYDYIRRGIQLAESDGAEALIIQLDTPGGQILTMQQTVQVMGQSKVPVIVYVTPNGAMAASAGTLIVLAGHAAAMAPGTVIGAASPVGSQGEDLPQTEAAKTKEVMKALARTLATRRGDKAVQLANNMIDNAQAVSDQEALQAGMIDFIATDVNDLLRQLNGFEVNVQGQTVKLDTTGVDIVRIAPNAVESLLRAILDPNISFLLLTIGVQAILIELANPGGWVPGFIGVVCMALFIYSINIIPINGLGLILIGVAFVLFFLDIKTPTHGALTVVGLGTFIAGALILFNTTPGPEQTALPRLSPWLAIGTGAVTALFFGFIVRKAVQAQHRPTVAGVESLVGRVGQAQTDLNPRGMVHVFGELWTAEAQGEPVPAGTRIQVVQVDGLTLRVRRYPQDGGSRDK